MALAVPAFGLEVSDTTSTSSSPISSSPGSQSVEQTGKIFGRDVAVGSSPISSSPISSSLINFSPINSSPISSSPTSEAEGQTGGFLGRDVAVGSSPISSSPGSKSAELAEFKFVKRDMDLERLDAKIEAMIGSSEVVKILERDMVKVREGSYVPVKPNQAFIDRTARAQALNYFVKNLPIEERHDLNRFVYEKIELEEEDFPFHKNGVSCPEISQYFDRVPLFELESLVKEFYQ